MTKLEKELLAGLRAAYSSLMVYERDRTPFHRELERIIQMGTEKELKS